MRSDSVPCRCITYCALLYAAVYSTTPRGAHVLCSEHTLCFAQSRGSSSQHLMQSDQRLQGTLMTAMLPTGLCDTRAWPHSAEC